MKFEDEPNDDSEYYQYEYKTFFVQSLVDAMKGASTRIYVEDAHGNSRSRVVLNRDVSFVQLAEEFNAPMDNTVAATSLGTISGVSVGVGQTAGTLKAIVSDPVGYVKSMAKIVDVLKQLDKPGLLIKAMADGLEQQQKVANPYDFDEQRSLYEQFRTNYYLGMAGFEVLKAVAGAQALKAAKSSSKLSKVVDKLSTPKLRKAATVISRTRDTLNAPGHYAKTRIAARLADGGDLALTGARRLVDSTTVGKSLQKRYLLRKTDIDVSDLSDAEQDALVKYLDETGEDGLWLANKYDDEMRRLLKGSCSVASLGGGSLGDDRFHSVRAPQPSVSAGGCDTDIDAVGHGEARRIRELQKRNVLDDDSVEQLLKVIDESGSVTQDDVKVALTRISTETGTGSSLKVDSFVSARHMNDQFPDEWNDPFASGTIVTRFKTTGDETFVRVHIANNQNGRFLMRQSDIEGLSPAEIEKKFSLTYTPEYVSDVTVPRGTRINMGSVKANFGGDEGAKQFNLGRELDDNQFTDRRLIED